MLVTLFCFRNISPMFACFGRVIVDDLRRHGFYEGSGFHKPRSI